MMAIRGFLRLKSKGERKNHQDKEGQTWFHRVWNLMGVEFNPLKLTIKTPRSCLG